MFLLLIKKVNMKLESKIIVNDKSFEFKKIDEEIYEMQINEHSKIIRQLYLDKPVECWTLRQEYTCKLGGENKDIKVKADVYHGRLISDEKFMSTLLDHILSELVLIDENGEEIKKD